MGRTPGHAPTVAFSVARGALQAERQLTLYPFIDGDDASATIVPSCDGAEKHFIRVAILASATDATRTTAQGAWSFDIGRRRWREEIS